MFIDTSIAFFMEIKCLHLNEYQYWFFYPFHFLSFYDWGKKHKRKFYRKIQTESEYFFVLMNMGVIFLEF